MIVNCPKLPKTAMVDFSTKADDGRVHFVLPVLDHLVLSQPDNSPAEAAALCSFPEQLNLLIYCSPQNKRAKNPTLGLQKGIKLFPKPGSQNKAVQICCFCIFEV